MADVTETLEKFNNGEQRYQDDTRFKEAVDSLAARIGVYAVLDKALNELRVIRRLQSETMAQNRHLTEEVKSLAKQNKCLTEVLDAEIKKT